MRAAGILTAISSLPSPYGIGCFSREAYEFADQLKKAGQTYWQILPLGPTGYGDSPYQSFSSFAGNPYFIDLDQLAEEGLLKKEEYRQVDFGSDPGSVDYEKLYLHRMEVLRIAFERADPQKEEGYQEFVRREADWLDDYCLFMAIKEAHEGRCWLDWEEEIRVPTPASRKKWEEKLQERIDYYRFIQFIFQKQWLELRDYAHEHEVEIIGDIPIFVALDSCDVWANQKYFQLDSKGYPLCVAGVPPDYFSATGQLWGNPLYDWAYQKKTGYKWWVSRVRTQLKLVDHLRIDHFRGFEAYWSVPAGDETAENGKWVKGPGEDLFLTLQKELGDELSIFAEDLGVITPEVEQLRDAFAFPGMKVLQFGFGDLNDRNYIPHFYTTVNCLCYTGTHDNDTTMGWYAVQPEEVKDRIRRYGNTDGGRISLDFIRFCLGSVAKYAIFPIQDLLMLGSEARMNTPGVAAANWSFRYTQDMLSEERREWLKATTTLFGR